MHNSTAVDVYVGSGSDPIIEHSSGIRFAAYPSSLVHGGTNQVGRLFSAIEWP